MMMNSAPTASRTRRPARVPMSTIACASSRPASGVVLKDPATTESIGEQTITGGCLAITAFEGSAAHTESRHAETAAVLAARSYLAQKDTRNASRLLQKAWGAQPHPSLAAAYAEIVPDETPAARLARFSRLIAKSPDHEESRLLKAELAKGEAEHGH